MTPVEEWNEFFSKNFPDGAIITFLQTTEEAAPFDDSLQVVTDRILTIDVENDSPQITFTDFGTNRNFVLDVGAVEARDYGCYIETTETGQPNVTVSRNLSDDLKEALKDDGAY